MPEAMAIHLIETPSRARRRRTESPMAEPKVSRTKDNATASAVPAKIAAQST